MKSYADGEVKISEGLLEHISLCLVCRNCETVCPSGVRFGWAMDMTRRKIEERIDRSLTERFSRWLFFSSFDSLYRVRLVMRLLFLSRIPIVRSILRTLKIDRYLAVVDHDQARDSGGFIGVGHGRLFGADGERRFRVGFLAGCMMSTLFADIDRASIEVLNKNGCDVLLPGGQGCCGALQIHEGERDRAIRLARRNIDAFSKFSDLDAIVVNSAGCGAQMKEYGEMLRDDPSYSERSIAFSGKVMDFAEFLGRIPLNTNFSAVRMRVTYQDPCHLVHGQRVTKEPREILGKIPGLEVVEMEDSEQCCGGAGIYSAINPIMSGKILSRRMDSVYKTEAETIVASNPPCLLQYGLGIKNSKNLKVLHLAEILVLAYSNNHS